MNSNHTFDIFTDGSAINNIENAPTGSAIYIVNHKLLVACSNYGTNNKAELLAIKYALHVTKKNIELFRNSMFDNTLTIYSDSMYAINAVTGIYKAVANLNLINKCKQLIKDLSSININVIFKHVKAHTNSKDYASIYNSIVDKMANSMANELNKTSITKKWHKIINY